ncbi:unnamed protein product [Meloidogyne enterolobii]|uniref:Uncharacterized protein n=1 Tax=Meloidogyne enterolobii TaxID=390850 RepID=A0ACB0Z1I3_MELEN
MICPLYVSSGLCVIPPFNQFIPFPHIFLMATTLSIIRLPSLIFTKQKLKKLFLLHF